MTKKRAYVGSFVRVLLATGGLIVGATAGAGAATPAATAQSQQKTAVKPAATVAPKPLKAAIKPAATTPPTTGGGSGGGQLPSPGPNQGLQPGAESTSEPSQQATSGGGASTGSAQTASSNSASAVMFDMWGNVEGLGGLTAQRDQWLGTKGQNRRLEAVMIRPGAASPGWPACLQLTYMAHIANVGDTGWFTAPQMVGYVGGGVRMEGIAFKTAGTCATDYTVEYRCHQAGLGDTSPMADGTFCGTKGQGRQLEAVVVTIRKRTANSNQQAAPSVPGKSTVDFDTTAAITLPQNLPPIIGVSALPDQWTGTKGEGRTMMDFSVRPRSTWPACLKIEYMAHVAGFGDSAWYQAPSSMTKQGRIEGVAFRAAGSCANDYIVEYQCHVQGIGDMPRMYNGQLCGTRGQGRRMEAYLLTVRRK